MDQALEELSLVAFPELLRILQTKEGIHHHYIKGFDRDGREFY